MNILSRLESLHRTYGDDIFREAADSLSLEQLISDKLYRSLLMALSGDESERTKSVISEALQSYELSRVTEVFRSIKDL